MAIEKETANRMHLAIRILGTDSFKIRDSTHK